MLSHMKGGPSIEVLLNLALGEDAAIAEQAADVLKTQVFLYEADTERLGAAYEENASPKTFWKATRKRSSYETAGCAGED